MCDWVLVREREEARRSLRSVVEGREGLRLRVRRLEGSRCAAPGKRERGKATDGGSEELLDTSYSQSCTLPS